jgi:hypothetical protein
MYRPCEMRSYSDAGDTGNDGLDQRWIRACLCVLYGNVLHTVNGRRLFDSLTLVTLGGARAPRVVELILGRLGGDGLLVAVVNSKPSTSVLLRGASAWSVTKHRTVPSSCGRSRLHDASRESTSDVDPPSDFPDSD